MRFIEFDTDKTTTDDDYLSIWHLSKQTIEEWTEETFTDEEFRDIIHNMNDIDCFWQDVSKTIRELVSDMINEGEIKSSISDREDEIEDEY